MAQDPNAPVIVAVAQQTWREPDIQRTPLAALQEVAGKALESANCPRLLQAIDTVATVRFIMDTDPNLAALLPGNPGQLLADRIGIKGAACYQTVIGGNTPQVLVNHFARQLAAGEVGAVLLSGAEFLNTFFDALRQGHDISGWKDEEAGSPLMLGAERDGLNEQEKAHGLYEPINTYPLFENALRHAAGGPDSEPPVTAQLCAGMSAVAAANPHAWRRDPLTANEIATVTGKNRYIGYPYTRLMNALLAVDMAAALIMTTAGKARELGIAAEQLVYLRAGTDVNDTWHVSAREALHRAPAISMATRAVLERAGLDLAAISRFDIYSCFPSAVQIACREIGLAPLDARGVTVTGGLPYFGGPGNNYSLHAIAEMVAQLRDQRGHGLVTANGLYLTKHSIGLYSTEPPAGTWQAIDSRPLQQTIDSSPTVPLADQATGPATVETYTVAHDRDGPARGIIVARNSLGERVLANTTDETTLRQLLAKNPIGQQGNITAGDEANLFDF